MRKFILRAGAVALLCSPAIFGYIRQVTATSTPVPLVRVDNTGIQFYINNQIAAGFQTSASGSAVVVIAKDSNPIDAARKALATWNALGTANVNFLPLTTTTAVINSSDFQHTIAFGSTAADISAVGGALAVTIDSYVTSPANGNATTGLVACSANCTYPAGGIYDSDIVLNPAYTFSTTGDPNTHDLQAVLLHELGHSLSANHTGILGASMFQYPFQHFLTSDDIAFVESAYPLPSGAAPLGTIGGTVATSLGTGVPYALLTAFDTATGVTVGGGADANGNYSFDVPPGNYQLYAEPLNGVVPINIYLNSTAAAQASGTKFQTTMYSGALSVSAGGSVTANITVTSGATSIQAPAVSVTAPGASVTTCTIGGPAVVPSGGQVDLVLAGAGFDGSLTAPNFAFYGPGISLQAGSIRVDSSQQCNGFNLLRLTLNIAAVQAPSLASFVVTNGPNSISFSGALALVPPAPVFTASGVISAAAYTGIPSEVSPGGIYSIYAPSTGPQTLGPAAYVQNGPYNAYGELDSTLAGVTVTFNGIPAPMFLSWSNQLNFQVPFEMAGLTTAQVIVNYYGSASEPVAVKVVPSQPSFFTINSDGKTVIAVNADGTLNTLQNPAKRGSYVTVYGTGVGPVSYTVLTGQAAPAPLSGFSGNYTYSIGGAPAAAAAFGGWTPTAVGLAQWDLLIPTTAPTGAVSIKVQDSSGATSQPNAIIYVQ